MPYIRDRLLAETLKLTTVNPENIIKEVSDIIIYYLENCEITIAEDRRFFVNVNCDRLMEKSFQKRAEWVNNTYPLPNLEAGQKAMAFTGTYDFGHTSPDWETVIPLGIWGLKRRVEEKAAAHPENTFYRETLRVYNAEIDFILRSAELAEKAGKTRVK